MRIDSFRPLAFLLLAAATQVVAAPASVAVAPLGDDDRAQQSALNNDNFSSTGPAGPRVTAAVRQALTAAGATLLPADQAAAVLNGAVTAAWVNPGMLPTNSVSLRYHLVDRASNAVLAEGNVTGTGFNDPDAAADLGKRLARKIMR